MSSEYRKRWFIESMQVCVCVVYLHITFHTSSFGGALVISVKQNYMHEAAMLFYILFLGKVDIVKIFITTQIFRIQY
jgi:hypothetical protein